MYRTICTELWTDPEVRRLPVHGKLLFVYLITNPHSHLAGIYSLPQATIQFHTGLPDRVSNEALDTLSEHGLSFYDRERFIVWVVNMFAYQGQGPKNEQAAANQLLTLHHSPLCERFLEHYPAVRAYVKKPGRIYRDTVTPSLRFTILKRDGFRCQYCGVTGRDSLLEIDHILPVSAGGTDVESNLRTACLRCNQGKGDDTLSDSGKRCPSVPDPDSVPVSERKESEKGERQSKTSFPLDWNLDHINPDDPKGQSWAKFGINPFIEFARFKDHALAEDRRCKDWKAAWRNWARKAIDLKEARK